MDYFDAADLDARLHRRDGRFTADPGFEDHPAVEISWYGARGYSLWRGKRLPTEAKWEKAARETDRRRHPWGDTPPGPEHAVFGRPYTATDRTDGRPSGAGPTGVEDLVGNLREWSARVVRGASHDDPPKTLRVTTRRFCSYDGPHRGLARGHHHVGFRCATLEDLGGY